VSVFSAVNEWIVSNQALVISAGIPIFTLLVTGWASFLSHRAKVGEVKLNGRVKLSEYRRANFDELLRLSSRLQSLFLETAMKNLRSPLRGVGTHDTAILETLECANSFLLRSKANLEQTKHFSDCLMICVERIFHEKHADDPTENFLGKLRVICKEILDQEWEQIVKELEGITP